MAKMDNETAKRLLSEGAVFILENLPKGSEFGIDMNVYTVGEKFMGEYFVDGMIFDECSHV